MQHPPYGPLHLLPAFPPKVKLTATDSATIKYVVTNQSQRPHRLMMQPIKGISSSGCAAALSYKQSCVLSLSVNGSALSANVYGGPILCAQGNLNQCYRPSSSDELNIQLSASPATVTIAAGQYSSYDVDRPLLAVSANAGVTWTYPEAITAPVFTPNNSHPFTSQGYFSGSSCTANICIAAGYYFDGTVTRPLLAASANMGATWTYPEPITRPVFTPNNSNPFSDGYFSSASCTANTCIAAGGYSDSSNSYRPLVAVSANMGATWTYPESITAPVFTPNNSHPFNEGDFNGASCTTNTCIAAGSYVDGTVTRPLLAVSANMGATWTYPETITAPVFAPNNTHLFSSGEFYSASCTANTCIAAGYYVDDGSVARPLLAVSINAGMSWTFPEFITAPVFTPNNSNPFSEGAFTSASCTANTCIAVGNYVDSTVVSRPLLAVSTDRGATWTYPESITAPVFTPNNSHPFSRDGYFRGASCTANTCIAVGTYFDGTAPRPLLAVSTDRGATWTYPESITAPVFTPNNSNPFSAGGFDGASCTANTCSAAGGYYDGLVTRPLLAVSTNAGMSWTYPEAITAPVFTPNNSNPFNDYGIFNSASGNNNVLLPQSLHFLMNKMPLGLVKQVEREEIRRGLYGTHKKH